MFKVVHSASQKTTCETEQSVNCNWDQVLAHKLMSPHPGSPLSLFLPLSHLHPLPSGVALPFKEVAQERLPQALVSKEPRMKYILEPSMPSVLPPSITDPSVFPMRFLFLFQILLLVLL